jgi:hypothetical protein
METLVHDILVYAEAAIGAGEEIPSVDANLVLDKTLLIFGAD